MPWCCIIFFQLALFVLLWLFLLLHLTSSRPGATLSPAPAPPIKPKGVMF